MYTIHYNVEPLCSYDIISSYVDYKRLLYKSFDFWAENFRMVDIEINTWSPGFTKPEIWLIRIWDEKLQFIHDNSW